MRWAMTLHRKVTSVCDAKSTGMAQRLRAAQCSRADPVGGLGGRGFQADEQDTVDCRR
jgi:hypothetical protein